MRKIVVSQFSPKANSSEQMVMALLEDQTLMEIQCDSPEEEFHIGDIYVGRIKRIVPSMNAAFVEIATGKECYLKLVEPENAIILKKNNSPKLCQDDLLLVQIEKEAIKSKPAALTCNITFNGKYLVLSAIDRRLSVSNKLGNEDKKRLRDWAEPLSDQDCGLIIRTAAANQPLEVLEREYQSLYKAYRDVIDKAPYRTPFTCMQKGPSTAMNFVREFADSNTEILTDIPEVYAELADKEYEASLSQYGQGRFAPIPSVAGGSIQFYEDEDMPLASLYSLKTKLEHLLQEKVWMKSGGFLMIQHTEAMTVIDVNSGKSINKKDAESQYLKINLEAVQVIADQIRLRNISGIIMIDFIDQKDKENRERILIELKAAVKYDKVPTHVVDMTRLQIVEMTRKKIKKSLKEQLT